MVGDDAGPLPSIICTPETLPLRADKGLFTCRSAILSALRTPADPVNASRFCLPKATTITSSICFESDFITMRISGLMVAVTGVIPIYETINSRAVLGTLSSVNFPSRLVATPSVVSLTFTEAPIIGSPDSSTTVPLTFIVCAAAKKATRQRIINVAVLLIIE